MQCLPELKNGHFWGHLCLSNTIMTICWKCLDNSEPYKIAYSKCYSPSIFFFFIIYSTDIEYHQNAIYSVKRKGGDTASVPAVMAHHLFSQLIPGNKYCINNRSRNLPNVCPCQQPNCGKEIKAGCTALGTYMFSKLHFSRVEIMP